MDESRAHQSQPGERSAEIEPILSVALQAHNPLRTDHCAACDYLLTGLSESGICPECGTPYDKSLIVLRGRVPGGLQKAAPGVFVIFLAAQVAMLLLLYRIRWDGYGLAGACLASIVAGLAAIVYGWVYESCRRRFCPVPLETRLWLSPRGFAYTGPAGTSRVIPWGAYMTVSISPLSAGRYRLEVLDRSVRRILPRRYFLDMASSPGEVERILARLDGWRRRPLSCP